MSENFNRKQYEQATPMPAKFLLPDGTVVDELPTSGGQGDVYSTEETVIGTFLGKPLYRRFIYFPTPAATVQNGSTFTEGVSMPVRTVSIIQDIVTCKIFRFTNNRAMINLSCMRTSVIQFKVYIHETFNNCDAMSIEYTKTTD